MPGLRFHRESRDEVDDPNCCMCRGNGLIACCKKSSHGDVLAGAVVSLSINCISKACSREVKSAFGISSH